MLTRSLTGASSLLYPLAALLRPAASPDLNHENQDDEETAAAGADG
jgi:hypothetical protein